MSLHFPLPKLRTFRFSLHTSRLSLHGEVTIVALKFATSSHFPLPKNFSPSLFPLFQMARAARRVIIIIGSAEALPILCVRYFRWERERDTERERETEVTSPLSRDWRWIHTFTCQKFAQLAMSLHFPLPKIRTFHFSLHTSRLSLHGEVTIVALKFEMS